MECAGSHLRGSCTGPATLRCGACGAVRYCSQQHQKRHWREHSQLCSRMADQMQRAPALYDFPFSFAPQTTSCSLLETLNLHGEPLWKASCDCFQIPPSVATDWHLPASSCPCKPLEDSSSPPGQLQSWAAFYNWRGIPFDSPVAVLLHWPLSLYHAIGISQIRNPKSLHVHYLGPERELDQLAVFGELLAVFPGALFHIDFVGPGVPEEKSLEFSTFCRCSDVECACKNPKPVGKITMRLWRGLYHDRYSELGGIPDLIFGANAGIAAFSSWYPTLKLIESLNVPALFTDYCEEAAVMAVQTIQSLFQCKEVRFPVQVNPFRQPLSSRNDLDLPTLSNAFIFGINGPSYAP